MTKRKTTIIKVSPSLSFELWSLMKYVKGRKKALIALIATGLVYLITNHELAALIAGLAFETVYSLVEFYLKEVEVE